MKKTLFIIILLFVISFFVDIPNYVELNDLAIIDKVTCKNEIVFLREIIPIKDDTGISYKYKKYKITISDKNNITTELENKLDKNIYFKNIIIIKNLTNC